MLSLVLVLNTILPQAAVFAQEATNANNLAATEATANTEATKTMATKEMTVPTVAAATTEATVTAASTVKVTVEDLNPLLGSMVVTGLNNQTGSGAYPLGSTITVKVTTTPGFNVSSISAESTNGDTQQVDNTSTANFVLNGDVSITCEFNNVICDVVVESSDITKGTVSPSSGNIPYGSSVLLNAIPNTGYECISYSFSYGNDSIFYKYSGPISVPVTQSGTYQLFFQPQTFNLSVLSDGNGTVTGAGNYENNKPRQPLLPPRNLAMHLADGHTIMGQP